MTDARCWRCTHKLLTNENAVGSVIIKCTNCKAMNRVALDRNAVATAT